MTERFDCQDAAEKTDGLEAARQAIADKQCIVMPTDTVYGIAADAFSPQAVATLLAAKGRGRSMPPPVLIARPAALDGLAANVPEQARTLADRFWPGALTLILHAQPSLTWDLGETRGTVALRMPDDDLARELLEATGPLAVSSANRSGRPAATTADDAEAQLGESVAVYLADGPRPAGAAAAAEAQPSTIVDCTGDELRVVRQGALSLADLRAAVPGIVGLDGDRADAAEPEDPARGVEQNGDAGSAEPETGSGTTAGTGS